MMKRLGLLAGSLLMVAAVRQSALPDTLQKDFDKLHDAKSLKVTYTVRVVGEAPSDYKLTLAKPNLFSLESPDGFTVSDGKEIYHYTKATNSYTKTDVTDDSLAQFFKGKEVYGWSAFFVKDPGSKIATATNGPDKTIKGTEVQVVDFAAKSGKDTGSLFIDPKLGVVRGFDLKRGDKEYLALASDIQVGSDSLDDSLFAFKAPDGALEQAAAAASTGGTFAQVSGILQTSCMPCHDANHKRAGIDLTTYAGISAQVTPGDAANSLLVKSLYGNGVDLMPKGGSPLDADKIHAIETWVTNGAKQD